jgi:hypothetical protein
MRRAHFTFSSENQIMRVSLLLVIAATLLAACSVETKVDVPRDTIELEPGTDVVDSIDAIDTHALELSDTPRTVPPVDTVGRDTATTRADSLARLAARADSLRVWVRAVRDSLQFQIDARTLAKGQTVDVVTIESVLKDSLGRTVGTIVSEFRGLKGGSLHGRSAAHRHGAATLVRAPTYRYDVSGAGLRTKRTLTGRIAASGKAPQPWPVVRVAPPVKRDTVPPTPSRRRSIDPGGGVPPSGGSGSGQAGRRR